MPPKPSFVVFANLETFEELSQLCRCKSACAHGELVTFHGATQLTEQQAGLEDSRSWATQMEWHTKGQPGPQGEQ